MAHRKVTVTRYPISPHPFLSGDKHIAELEFQAAPWYNEAEPASGETRKPQPAEEAAPQAKADHEVPQVLQDVPVPSQSADVAEPDKVQEPVAELRYSSGEAEESEQGPMILLASADDSEVSKAEEQVNVAPAEDTKAGAEGKDGYEGGEQKSQVSQVPLSNQGAKPSRSTDELKQGTVGAAEVKTDVQEKHDARTL